MFCIPCLLRRAKNRLTAFMFCSHAEAELIGRSKGFIRAAQEMASQSPTYVNGGLKG